MSPWWSRPTADELPEDYDPEEDEDFEQDEESAEGLQASDDSGEEPSGDDARPGRRRRRRRRTRPRSESEAGEAAPPEKAQPEKKAAGTSSEDDAEKGAKEAEDDAESARPARRRRRRRAAGDETEKSAKTEKKDEPKAAAKTDKQDGKKPEAKKPEPKKAEAKRVETQPEKRVEKKVSFDTRAGGRDERRDDRRDDRRPEKRIADFSFEGTPAEVAELSREIDISASTRSHTVNDERKIALFCDLENIALGVRDSSEVNKFDILLVLERLLEKGKIIVKKAYCDWERYSDYKRAFHEAGIELIDIPQKYYAGKNSADIKMVVDAMDLSYSKEHLDTFVVLSGDSDFTPLVSKLKENNKYVIGVGVKNSSSNLLVNNCDEFIYYEDIWRDTQTGPQLDGLDPKTAKAFQLMVDSIQALLRENKDVLWGSMIKQTMQRKKPSFNEGYYGYGSFSELLEDAEKKNVVRLKKDKRSGSYIVTGFS